MNNEPEGPPADEKTGDKKDFCVAAGDVPPNCAGCDYFMTCESDRKVHPGILTQEPVAPVALIAVDVSSIFSVEEIKFRTGQQQTEDLRQQSLEKFRTAIIRHLEINQTKGLDVCTATVIYLQLMAMPIGTIATYIIQTVADILCVYDELKGDRPVVTLKTPERVRIN
jgi:hypothetical protein